MSFAWGIVGFGWVARDFFAPAALAAGHSIAWVVDPDPHAQAAARAIGVTVTDTLDPANACYVATPNDKHRLACRAAARARLPILCEKPMATTLADASHIARGVREAGVPYGTAYDQRWHPAHLAVRDAIAAGHIGRPTAVRIVYACWVGQDFAPTGSGDNWRVDPLRAGGGALIDLAPHGLDLTQFLLGEPVISIAAELQQRVHGYPVDDGAMLLGRTASGVLVQLHVAYNMPEMLPRRRLEVTGDAGLLSATSTMGQTPGGTLTLTPAATGQPQPIPFATTSPFQLQAEAFAAHVRGHLPGAFDLDRDLHTMRLIDSANRQSLAA